MELAYNIFISGDRKYAEELHLLLKKITNNSKTYSLLNKVAAGANLNSYRLQIKISDLMQTQYRVVKI